jgi:hypothetical protein
MTQPECLEHRMQVVREMLRVVRIEGNDLGPLLELHGWYVREMLAGMTTADVAPRDTIQPTRPGLRLVVDNTRET